MQHRFTAEILGETSGGAHVVIPFDARAAFGSARAKVVVTFDRHPYRGSISPMGGQSLLLLRKDVQEAIGRGPGDTVEVTVSLDTEPREVEVPDDFAAALDGAGVRERFERMAFTHRKEYARWILEAKRPETRERRIRKAAEMIAAGEKRS